METLLISAIVFLSVFTQSLAGFGVALVAMALLPGVVGLQIATPLVSLVAMLLEFFLLARYHKALTWKVVLPISIASLITIPVGVVALKRLDEDVVLRVLGVVLVGYAAYSMFNLRLPRLAHPAWAYGSGLVAGLLGGAYNTAGPPVIIYGACQGWTPDEFKGNLQGFFVINNFMVVASHAWSHNYTPVVWQTFLWTLPAIFLGILGGLSLDRFVPAAAFRKLVLALVFIMGVRLMI